MGVGDAHPFQQALDAAILAPAAVQGVENDVGFDLGQALREVGAGIDLDHVISLAAQRLGAALTRAERHLALGGGATHQDHDAGRRSARTCHQPIASVCRRNSVARSAVYRCAPFLVRGSVARQPYDPGRPMRLISHSSVIPLCSKTLFRTSSPRPWRSAADAPPALTRKLECIGDICAPPRVAPRIPASSITLHAFRSWVSSARPVEENPAGLRKLDPAVRSLVGWVASRLASCSSIRAASASGSPSGAVKRTSVTTASSGRSVWR